MRIIKFRVWDAKYNCYMQTDKWGIGYVAAGGRGYSLHAVIINETLTDKIHEEIPFNGSNPRWTVEQFTGVQDSNQKDIYEGDIVKFDKDTYQILWSEENAAFISLNKTNMAGAFLNPLYVLNFEVIGNINQNPELT